MTTKPLPLAFAEDDWYSALFISVQLGVPLRTIQRWCKNGFFIKRGCRVLLSSCRRGYWVHIPKAMSKDAILRRIALDIPLANPYYPNREHEGSIQGSGTPPLCEGPSGLGVVCSAAGD